MHGFFTYFKTIFYHPSKLPTLREINHKTIPNCPSRSLNIQEFLETLPKNNRKERPFRLHESNSFLGSAWEMMQKSDDTPVSGDQKRLTPGASMDFDRGGGEIALFGSVTWQEESTIDGSFPHSQTIHGAGI